MHKENLVENKAELISENFLPISAKALREKFGTASNIYSELTKRLKIHLEKVKYEPSIKAKLDDWTNTIETLYGYKPDLSLFVDHTYLVALTKITTYLKLNNNKPDKKDIIEVINGKYFIDKGITNFIDDFSGWLLNSKIEEESLALLWIFVETLSNYDFSNIDEDLFRELYEEIIEPKERHKAGEYYTPEWLVQLILEEIIPLWEEKKGNAIPKIIDPACGSGTFLYRTIRVLIEKGVSLKDIIKNVAGADINPIATITAKANYLIAIADLIEILNLEELNLPVYTKDCLKSPDLFDCDVKIGEYDIIIGNPPWVVMRSMKNKKYQNFLKEEVWKYQLLESKDVHLFTQMELATLFFCKCADLYLKSHGIIAFVMPRSVIAGTIHHINFRRFKNPPINLVKIIDLDQVTPLFNMPSCVLIGFKKGSTQYPVLLEKHTGQLTNRNVKISEAKTRLSAEACEYIPPDFSSTQSYYYNKFRVGASIFPRSFYFVDIISHKNSQLTVKTSSEIYHIVKEPWKMVLGGAIESEFLYATLLAWEIIPFYYLNLRPAVLPVEKHINFNSYKLLNANELRRKGLFGVAEWFEKAEAIWHKNRTEKSEKRFPSLLDRLNYNDLLVTQNPSKRYVVLYNATGTNLVSCVIDKQSLPCFMVNGESVKPKDFITDVKTWFFETESEMEGYYLRAIFNSGTINEMIKPLQPRGLFGARAIHRRPLTLPIPKFDNKNRLHLEIARIGRKAHERIKTVKFSQKNSIRAEVRKELKDEIAGIDQIVSKLIMKEE